MLVSRTLRASRASFERGQPFLHRIEILAPFGADTVSRLIRAPPDASAPAKRIFGNGRRIFKLLIDEAPATPLDALTTTLTNVMSVLPSSSVTLSPTRCVPTE